ncbi:hypothetical protein OG866_43625 [Streptomyces sp. NBC_00663]|uniref:hypothetical protein n=1 Tax=Streptomyces sp. NBC_00663 TaxID=2975801 RepID=UPI002E2FED6A|nr:hypothetical protein [Streptomyces sp. NBC_00663]
MREHVLSVVSCGTWEVDNSVWIVGDDHEAVVIDAAHDADATAEAPHLGAWIARGR